MKLISIACNNQQHTPYLFFPCLALPPFSPKSLLDYLSLPLLESNRNIRKGRFPSSLSAAHSEPSRVLVLVFSAWV